MIHAEKAQKILDTFEVEITSDDYPSEAHKCAEIHVKAMIEEARLTENLIREDYWKKTLAELNLL